jgi:hypothetical protein
MLRDLQELEYTIKGDAATAEDGTLQFVRVGQQWRVRIPQPDPDGTDWTRICGLLATFENELAADVEAGKYRDVDDFKKAARARFEAYEGPTTRPAG